MAAEPHRTVLTVAPASALPAAPAPAERDRLVRRARALTWLGLGANALFGWWWADPAAALIIAAVATQEGVNAWRGESCDCC